MSSRIRRYLLFATIYFAEGAILSYSTALNGLYLRRFDVPLTLIGLMGMLALLPFVLKIFLGMLSDRVSLFGRGHRRPYILLGILVQCTCLVLIPLINPGTNFTLFALAAFIMMTGQALYDTCTDGLALDTTSPEEEGRVQGIMVGGRALGVVLISALIGLIAERSSWPAAFYTLAALTLIPLPFLALVHEPQRDSGQRFEWRAFSAFRSWPVIALCILGVVYSLVINGANQILNLWLTQLFQITLGTAGLVTTVWGIGVVLGGLSGGWLIDRIGQRNAVITAVVMTLVSLVLLSNPPSMTVAWGFAALFGLAFGFFETVFFAIAMRLTDTRIAASMFALLMAGANIGTGIGLGVSGALAENLGFSPVFLILAAVNLTILLLLPLLFPRRVKTDPRPTKA